MLQPEYFVRTISTPSLLMPSAASHEEELQSHAPYLRGKIRKIHQVFFQSILPVKFILQIGWFSTSMSLLCQPYLKVKCGAEGLLVWFTMIMPLLWQPSVKIEYGTEGLMDWFSMSMPLLGLGSILNSGIFRFCNSNSTVYNFSTYSN